MVFCGEVVFHFLTRPPHQSWFCCLLTLHTFTSRLGWGSFNMSQLNNFLIFCFKFVWQNTRRREYRERHSAQTVLCLPNKNRLVCWLYCGKMHSRDWLRSPQVCGDSQTCRFNRVQELLTESVFLLQEVLSPPEPGTCPLWLDLPFAPHGVWDD